jgi:hypothetical protein
LEQLHRLVYLDLSINQLTGPFPVWVNRLRSLTLLNLGQNDFSGNIPRSFTLPRSFILGDNGSHRFLRNMPVLIQQLILSNRNGRSLRDRHLWHPFVRNYILFLKKHHAFKNISPNMLWVDSENLNIRDAKELEKIVDEYLKAEEKHLDTKIFQILRNQNNGRLQDLFQNGYMVKKIEGS